MIVHISALHRNSTARFYGHLTFTFFVFFWGGGEGVGIIAISLSPLCLNIIIERANTKHGLISIAVKKFIETTAMV